MLAPRKIKYRKSQKGRMKGLAKGGDYEIETIVGHEVVQKNGGEVILVPFVDGFSSTTIIEKIRKS